MKKEDVATLSRITDLKKELLMMRIKLSLGEEIVVKSYKHKKKEVARLFTTLNNKKIAAQ